MRLSVKEDLTVALPNPLMCRCRGVGSKASVLGLSACLLLLESQRGVKPHHQIHRTSHRSNNCRVTSPSPIA